MPYSETRRKKDVAYRAAHKEELARKERERYASRRDQRPVRVKPERLPPVPCAISGCTKLARWRGWCQKHYSRWWKHGDPIAPGHRQWGSVTERFWSKVNRSGDCWVWTAGCDGHGYGTLGAGGANGAHLRAHRVSYEVHYGPFPQELDVLHRCDNPPCVRPDHLFLGDARANGRDMAAKGRAVYQRHPEKAPRGERSHFAKLTDKLVVEARRRFSAGVMIMELAREYGVSDAAMSDALKGRTWRHVGLEAN